MKLLNFILIILARILVIQSLSLTTYAQGIKTTLGSRANALGGAGVTLSDNYAWTNNPAGASETKTTNIATSYQSISALSGLSQIMLQTSIPIRSVVTGIIFERYGDKWYSEQKVGIGIASKISNFSIGTKLQLLQIAMNELPTRWSYIAELGGIAQIHEKVFWGAHIWNVSLSELNINNQPEIPLVLRTGISYRPSNKVILNTEIVKNINYKPTIRVGLEYKIIQAIAIRTGINTKPAIYNFGVGIYFKKYILDYAISSYQNLGWGHSISLSIALKNK